MERVHEVVGLCRALAPVLLPRLDVAVVPRARVRRCAVLRAGGRVEDRRGRPVEPHDRGHLVLGIVAEVRERIEKDVRVIAGQPVAVVHRERHRLLDAAAVRHLRGGEVPPGRSGTGRVVREIGSPEHRAGGGVDHRDDVLAGRRHRVGTPRQLRAAAVEVHERGAVVGRRSGCAGARQRLVAAHRRRARRAPPERVRGRSADVDQATVGRDGGEQPVVEGLESVDRLGPGQMVRAVDVDVVAPQVERAEVLLVQPQRGRVVADPAHGDGRGRQRRRVGQHAVQPADEARRPGAGIEVEDAAATERARERGAPVGLGDGQRAGRGDRSPHVDVPGLAGAPGRRGVPGGRQSGGRRRQERRCHGERGRDDEAGKASGHGVRVAPRSGSQGGYRSPARTPATFGGRERDRPGAAR